MRVLITGANGFIGRELCALLQSKTFEVRRAIRNVERLTHGPQGSDYICVGDLSSSTNWSEALDGVEVVIHLAGRAHVKEEPGVDSLNLFRRVNSDATLRLAEEALKHGVKRFIFLSSIGVNGSFNKRPFTEIDIPSPTQNYAISKFEAEQRLQKVASPQMEVVIIRPPLVYGRGAPGNFSRLMHWTNKKVPLPLGAIHNKKSFIALDNLLDLILVCIDHPAAANEIFLVSDGDDLSTSDFLRRIASALNKRPLLIPVHQKLLGCIFWLIGRNDLRRQLCSSLQVDITKAKKLLNWSPPFTVDEALRKMCSVSSIGHANE